MKRWIVALSVVMGAIFAFVTVVQASQKPLKQPDMLQSDRAISMAPSLVEDVYTKGMVLHTLGKTQIWFDERVTRQKHWGSMWVWPLKPGQKLCVRALALPTNDDLVLHPFLKHSALEWPSASMTESPVCFEYPDAQGIKSSPKKRPQKPPKKQSKPPKSGSDASQPKTPLMQKAIQAHWAIDDLKSLKARQRKIFSKIPTAGSRRFRKKHKIKRNASFPSDRSLRWVVLHYPKNSPHKDILANKVWQVTYHTKSPQKVTLPIGLSMGMWLGARWHVYGDVTHQWLKTSRSDSQPTFGRKNAHAIKFDDISTDDGGAFMDRAFIGSRTLEQRVLVSDLSWRAIDKRINQSDRRFGRWASMRASGVWGRFYLMPSLSHLKCVSVRSFVVRKADNKRHCQTHLTPGSFLTSISPYVIEFAQNAPVMYERGFRMISSDFHHSPELKWLPRKHLGIKDAPRVDKPNSKDRSMGCHAVPVYPAEAVLYVVAFLMICAMGRRRQHWPLLGVLIIFMLLVSNLAFARKPRLPREPEEVSKTLSTPFVSIAESTPNKKTDPRCRRYATLDIEGQVYKLSTWELLCIPFGRPLSKIYTQVLALPPSRYAMGKDIKQLPEASKRPFVTSLGATMESTSESNWIKFVGKRLPTSFSYRLKDYRLFVPQRGASACSFARRMKQKDVLLKLKQYESLCRSGWHTVVATSERYRRNFGVQGQKQDSSFVILPGLDVTLRFAREASSLDISPDGLPGTHTPSDVVINSHVMLSPEAFEPCFQMEKIALRFKPSKGRSAHKRIEMAYHLTSKPCKANTRGFALSPKSR